MNEAIRHANQLSLGADYTMLCHYDYLTNNISVRINTVPINRNISGIQANYDSDIAPDSLEHEIYKLLDILKEKHGRD